MNNKIIGIYLACILLLMTGCGRERKYDDSEIETFLEENLSASEVKKIGCYANEYYCVYIDSNGDKYYAIIDNKENYIAINMTNTINNDEEQLEKEYVGFINELNQRAKDSYSDDAKASYEVENISIHEMKSDKLESDKVVVVVAKYTIQNLNTEFTEQEDAITEETEVCLLDPNSKEEIYEFVLDWVE